MDIALKVTSGFLVACGTIAGAISLNPIVLGIVSGSGMLVFMLKVKTIRKI